MRSRMALRTTTAVLVMAALAVTVPILAGGSAAPAVKEAPTWSSSAVHDTRQQTMLLTPQNLKPLADFAAALEANALRTYAAAVAANLAAERSASSARDGSTSPGATTTQPPAGCTASPDGDYALDATTTATPDWCCIRAHESDRNGYRDYSGAYGFEGGDYGLMSDADQDALALRIFAANGDKFGPSAWSTHTVCGLR